MTQLIILFSALVIGYCIKRLPISNNGLNIFLLLIVLLILFVMGYNFGSELHNLANQLGGLVIAVITFTGLIFIFNFIISVLVFRHENKVFKLNQTMQQQDANLMVYLWQSAKYLSIIAIGIIVGSLIKQPLQYFENIINILLILLLFIIGHQMRISGTALHKVIVNKNGIKLATTIIVSSLLAGVVASIILNMPINQALAMSSGFGWYTLSSILVGSLIHQDYSAVSFFIDFGRELIAIILLPSLGRLFPYTMVGVCGATAMDFSLPVIKQNLGEQMVIIAISSGMIMSLVTPFLIPLFAKL